VGSASQLDVLDRGLSTRAMGMHVVELEASAFGAAAAAGGDERAARAVTHPHGALDRRRDVARARLGAPARTRPGRGRELPPRQVLEQETQRPIDDGRHISIRE
jgi:hypothetical protein